MDHTAIVIGSGFSSLSAACYLARDGYDVTILEKNGDAGGRARQWKSEGFTFDIGPTWYWMPDVFENFFADFGYSPFDFYSLTRLDPSYRIYFGENNYENIPASREGLRQLFEKHEPGSSSRLNAFLDEAATTYRLAIKEMALKPGLNPFEYISRDTISHSHLFIQSLRTYVRKKFNHPYLISLLEFPVLFLGAKPSDIPAFYHFMNYADLGLGTWYPDGGMYSVVRGFQTLAEKLGVKFEFNSPVKGFDIRGGKIDRVFTHNRSYDAHLVVSGADYHHTESLLPPTSRNYNEDYWSKKILAPSALLFFVGINKKLDNAEHHMLFFDRSFDDHAWAIYDQPSWPTEPLFYVNIPSRTDPAIAPPGNEAMTFLIPIAPGIDDTDLIREEYFEKIITRFEQVTGENIRDHIVVSQSYGIHDFVHDYHSYKGNAYGLANTLFQTGYFRPSIRNKKIRNLFYTGQLTVPGGGVPPAIMSGKIVTTAISKKINPHAYAN